MSDSQMAAWISSISPRRMCQRASNYFAGAIDAGNRAVAEKFGFEELERGLGNLDLGVRAPEEPPPHDIRVQGADKHGDPPQRNAASEEPLGQLGQDFLRLWRGSRAVDQPLHNRSDLASGHRVD